MSLSLVRSRARLGLDARPVLVEVQLANGLPSFTLVGLADTEVKEARERVRAAVANAGLEFPSNKRTTVNLAPADLPKDSGRFDLPMALGILAASGQLSAAKLEGWALAGELSLGGDLRPVRGALAMSLALHLDAAQKSASPPAPALEQALTAADPKAGENERADAEADATVQAHEKRCQPARLLLPPGSAEEAALVPPAQVYRARHLHDVVDRFLPEGSAGEGQGEALPESDGWCRLATPAVAPVPDYTDLADVKGQAAARRALEIAAAGGHNLLMVGPPGAGKSMLAQRFAGQLPPMTTSEALASAALASLAGRFQLAQRGARPTCAPHHTVSAVTLVGGDSPPRPGEISLAHHGVRFLDELPASPRAALKALREPLESGIIRISRAALQSEFPARIQLVAAMNPCPCGYLGHPTRTCRDTTDQIARCQSKLSGPLLDRIDLHVEVPALPPEDLLQGGPGESSAAVRDRVAAARERALSRQGCTNQALAGQALQQQARGDAAALKFLNTAAARLDWSARSTHRALRVARTIADLAGADTVGVAHIAEAVQDRRVLRTG